MKQERAILYRAEKLDNLLVFKAEYQKFQFSRHAHEDFALGVMESGAQKINCQGKEFCAAPGSLITVNANDVHDGMSADGNAYLYRIIYIPDDLLQKIGAEMVTFRESHYFQSPVTVDRQIASQLRNIFILLDLPDVDLLEVQSHFYKVVADLLERHGTALHSYNPRKNSHAAVERACSFINDMARQNISLDQIASAAGLSRYHFLRVFNSIKGVTPHSYLLQRRLQLARESICQGSPIADAALSACFADQSHFSRRFKAAYGITPRQYQQAVC
jgi:AraC-like DNA-binding protein